MVVQCEVFGDALVACGFAGPAAFNGVVVEVADVVELLGDGVGSGGVGNEVVALLADVRVRACAGAGLAGAEPDRCAAGRGWMNCPTNTPHPSAAVVSRTH